jgi:hypothetical protein
MRFEMPRIKAHYQSNQVRLQLEGDISGIVKYLQEHAYQDIKKLSDAIPLHRIAYRTYGVSGIQVSFECPLSECYTTEIILRSSFLLGPNIPAGISNIVTKLHAPLSWSNPSHVIPTISQDLIERNATIIPWTDVDDECAIGVLKSLENIGKSFHFKDNDSPMKFELTPSKNPNPAVSADNPASFFGSTAAQGSQGASSTIDYRK